MNKEFWKKVIIIGLPVSLQNLINTMVNMVDTFMIGSLGEDFVSAVGLANKVFFVMNLLIFGISSGSGVLMSQYYGKRDDNGLNKTFGFMMLLSLIGSLIFFLGAIIMPGVLMRAFTNSDALIEIGIPYLRIVSISYIITAFSIATSSLCRSINKTRVPMLITFVSVFVNVFFNFIFIFGYLGAPKMEANGAALGTVLARGAEFLCMLLYLLFGKRDVKLNIKKIVSLNKNIIVRNLKITIPVILNEFGWGLGVTIYSVIYGHMSDDVVAAMTIASALMDLVSSLLFGIATACAVLVGNQLGANRLKDAEITAKKLIIAGIVVAAILGGILVALINPYLMLYKTSETVSNHIKSVCIIYACIMPIMCFNLINIVGILRSGGDTFACMLMELGALWLFGIPLGALGAFAFKLDIMWVYLLLQLEQVLKCVIGIIRYKQKKWVKNIVINNDLELEAVK